MNCNHRNRFASKLQSLEEAPELLRGRVRSVLKPNDEVRLLIFGPAVEALDNAPSATLLALLDDGWIIANDENGLPPVVRVSFSDTLLVELMLIPPYGRLKLDYVANATVRFATIYFNTSMEPIYKEAVRHLLSGIEGIASGAPMSDGRLNVLLQGVPLKFCNAAHAFRPFSQHVMAVRYWPTVSARRIGWFQRKLAPEAMLLLTEHELILISEEKARALLRIGRSNKCGNTGTYCPLLRLQSWSVGIRNNIAHLRVSLHNGQGGEDIQAEFPRNAKPDVEDFMGFVMEQRGTLQIEM